MRQLQDITKVNIWVCMVCAELHCGQTSLHTLVVTAAEAIQHR
jgi:uncharacterized UBP type Zn finger protein